MSPGILLFNCIYGFASFSVFAAVVVASIVRWGEVRPVFKRGLLVGLVLFVLTVPSVLGTVFHFNPEAFLPHSDNPTPEGAKEFVRIVTIAVTIAVALVSIPYTALQVAIGALSRARSQFPLLLAKEGSRTGLLLAFGAGVVAGVASIVSGRWANVSGSDWMKLFLENLAGVAWTSRWAVVGGTLAFILAAALSEEILFRGLIQGWVTRWLGSSRAAAAVAILFTTLLWASIHAVNTTAPGWKLAQIGIIGLGLGELARRYSVEASICAHVSLNLTVVLIGFLLGE